MGSLDKTFKEKTFLNKYQTRATRSMFYKKQFRAVGRSQTLGGHTLSYKLS